MSHFENDRTIAAIGAAAEAPKTMGFSTTFRIPGHVHLLRAAPDLLSDRQGHTELAITLAETAALPPAVAVCEMLDDETGRALAPSAAKVYAARSDLHYVDGKYLIKHSANK